MFAKHFVLHLILVRLGQSHGFASSIGCFHIQDGATKSVEETSGLFLTESHPPWRNPQIWENEFRINIIASMLLFNLY